jgi:hypothetical protein
MAISQYKHIYRSVLDKTMNPAAMVTVFMMFPNESLVMMMPPMTSAGS